MVRFTSVLFIIIPLGIATAPNQRFGLSEDGLDDEGFGRELVDS